MSDTGVALFVYRRPEHTRRVLESIKRNNIRKLYIFQDGCKEKKDLDCWKSVNELVKSITFAEVELHVSERNIGLANSIVKGVSYVLNKHNTVIVIEDDIILGDGYIDYMDECFERYKYDMRVYSIAGCDVPLIIPKDYEYDVFFTHRASSWGWGTWRNRWDKYKRDFNLVQEILKDSEKRAILDISGSDILSHVHGQLEAENDSWAAFWVLTIIDQKAVCVIPVKYLAKNIGFDGVGGTHTIKKYSRLMSDLNDKKDDFRFPPDIFVDKRIVRGYDIMLNDINTKKREDFYFKLLSCWIKSLQKGASVGNYLLGKGIDEVVIYGAGTASELLIDDIKNDIVIEFILVLDKNCTVFNGFPLYDFDDDIDISGKTVIVIPAWDMEFIEYSLKKRYGNISVIGIDEILNCCVNS